MASSSLSKVVPAWSTFFNENKQKNTTAICLLGTQNSGKSTLCQLFNAFIANKRHKDLIYDDAKVKQYLLPGVISSNSLKIETVKPMIYRIEAKVDNLPSLTIIDTPTFTLPPINESNKKPWTAIDSKVSFNYLTQSVSQCCFAFVIDERHTRAKMEGTKNILVSFIDGLKQYRKEIYDSTAFIITRCPAGISQENFFTRIEGCIKKIDDPNVKHIEQWFQNIKDRKALFIFNKLVSEEAVKQQVNFIYKQLTKLVPFKISNDTLKSFDDLKEELKQELRKYLNGLNSGIGGLIDVMLQIPESLIKSEAQYQSHKNQLAQKLFGVQGTDKVIKVETNQLPSIFSILSVCFSVSKLAGAEIDSNFFSGLLNQFVKNKILSQEEDLYIGLKERADFFQAFWDSQQKIVGWDAQLIGKDLQQKAAKIKEYKQVGQSIKDSFEQGKSTVYYEHIISLVEFLVPSKDLQSHQFLSIWINASLEIAAQLPKPKSLKRFLQIETKLTAWKKFDLVSNLLAKIAEVLISVNRVGFAVKLYNKCGNPYKGIQEMTKILQDKDMKKKYGIKDFQPYLQLLQDIGLYEKSYETCYLLGNVYDTQDRAIFKQILENTPTGPKKDTLQSFLEKKVKGLDEDSASELKILAQELDKEGTN